MIFIESKSLKDEKKLHYTVAFKRELLLGRKRGGTHHHHLVPELIKDAASHVAR